MSAVVSPVSLEDVKTILNLWRQKKKSRFEPIPEHIKVLIKQLTTKYSRDKIRNTLNLSCSKFKDIIRAEYDTKAVNVANSSTSKQNHFLPFRLISSDEGSVPSHHTKFEISNSTGAKLVIQSSDISSVIKAFLCSH